MEDLYGWSNGGDTTGLCMMAHGSLPPGLHPSECMHQAGHAREWIQCSWHDIYGGDTNKCAASGGQVHKNPAQKYRSGTTKRLPAGMDYSQDIIDYEKCSHVHDNWVSGYTMKKSTHTSNWRICSSTGDESRNSNNRKTVGWRHWWGKRLYSDESAMSSMQGWCWYPVWDQWNKAECKEEGRSWHQRWERPRACKDSHMSGLHLQEPTDRWDVKSWECSTREIEV